MKQLITKRRIFCAAVVLAVIIVPFLYSYFYLGAFWDPYSKLESLPVAVVNNDKGAKINDKQRNLGDEMCDRLKDDGSLKFVFTDTKDAKSGTEGTKYYAMITIPDNFSERIASADTDDKQTAKLTFSPNEKRNFLASQVLTRAIVEMEEETRSTVDKELVQTLADNIKDVPDQLGELQDGLGKLSDGSSDLFDATKKFAKGTNKLYDGTTTLTDGTKTLLSGSKKLSDGTGTLLNGTGTLLDGTDTLLSGTKTLADGTKTYYKKFGEFKAGISTLKAGSATLATGSDSLVTGIDQIKAGTDQLVEKTKNIGQITTGAKTLAEGTKTFDTGLTQYTTGVNTLISTVNSTSTFLAQYVKANPALLKDPTFAKFLAKMSDPSVAKSIQALSAAGTQLTTASSQLAAGAGQLYEGTAGLPDLNTALTKLDAGTAQVQDGAKKIDAGANKLNSGASDISTATNKLYNAAGDLADGATKVNKGTAKLNNGASDLNSGAKTLNSGADKLNNGVADLNDGASDLNSGANKLDSSANKLNNGAKKLNKGINKAKSGVDDSITDANEQVSKVDGLAEFASDPVDIDQKNVTSIPNYGTAFAPYFMSLSLWVGALLLFVGIYLDTEGRFKILSRESEHKVARSFMFLLIGLAQAITLALVVHKALGLKVDNVGLFYASVILVSLVFISIVQFLIVHLKSVGKLLSIVMLILQLTSCGGTFPMELVPKMFNVMYPFMPMTYSVALFKQSISDTKASEVWFNSGILFAILVVFMVLTILLSAIKSKKAANDNVQIPVQFEQ